MIGYAGAIQERSKQAVEQALSFPLNDNSIQHAEKLLFTITGGDDLTMHEIVDIASLILDTTDTEVQIKFGVEIDEKMQGKVKVTIIAAGIRDTDAPATIPPTKRTTVSPDMLDIPAFIRRRCGRGEVTFFVSFFDKVVRKCEWGV